MRARSKGRYAESACASNSSVYILYGPCCRYYVAHASKPKDRAALALAVGVGSLVEEDSERGVAHILEHLAFNATEVTPCAQKRPPPQHCIGHTMLFSLQQERISFETIKLCQCLL